jgi:Tol biopolymer transport system component/DNA-binding CsgD family transcriptional regulator
MTIAGRTSRPPERLTRRQEEVLELLRRNYTNEQIAQRLGISLDGAKWHVSEIIGRLGVADRYEAAGWRPEGEGRPWWSLVWLRELRWSAAAKATSVGALAIVTIAIIALAWGVWRASEETVSRVPRTMVVSTRGGAIAVDSYTGGVTQRFNALKDRAYLMSPDGSRLAFECTDDASANINATVDAWCIWDSATGPSVAVPWSQLPPAGWLWSQDESQNFVWSPDGTKFAFAVYQRIGGQKTNGDLYVKDLLSGDLRMVDRGSPVGGLRTLMRFSPDGTYVSMLEGPNAGGRADLVVVETDAKATNILTRDIPVTSGPAEQYSFIGQYAWSPDSRNIAFFVTDGLYVAPADGSTPPRRVTTTSGYDAPAWSPDGQWIAASGLSDQHAINVPSHTVIVRPDGTAERDIDGDLAVSGEPRWSPDARHLVFIGNTNAEMQGGDTLYVADLDGSPPRAINIGAPLAPFPLIAWSPDGDRLFYTAGSPGCSEDCEPGYLYMSSVDNSSSPRKLYDEPADQILGWID